MDKSEKTIDKLYRANLAAFIEDNCYLLDVDDDQVPIKKFTLFPYQVKALETLRKAYRKGEDCIIEKCRQTGVTWLMCAFLLWCVLFEKAFSALLLSYKQALVDNNTAFSLFGRIRFMTEKLPKRYRDKLDIAFCRIKNLKTGSYILGESTTTETSRGGSFKLGFWDETAATPKSEEIYAAFSQSCRSKFYISTPRGKNNVFYRLRHEAGIENIITVRWNDNPRHTDAWFEEQKRKLSAEQFCQEILIDYLSGLSGRIYKLDPSIHLRDDLVWNPEYETLIGWDFGIRDQTVAVVLQSDWEGVFQVIDALYGNNLPLRVYIDAVTGIENGFIERLSVKEQRIFRSFLENAKRRNYKNLLHHCGNEILQRSIQSGESIQNQFLTAYRLNDESEAKTIQRKGQYQKINLWPVVATVEARIATCKKLFDPMHCHVYFNNRNEAVRDLYEQLNLYTWGSGDSPKHDYASHFADAIGYALLAGSKKAHVRDIMTRTQRMRVNPQTHAGFKSIHYAGYKGNNKELDPYRINKEGTNSEDT